MFNKIAFIGAGSMSEAFISGIINKEYLRSEQIFVTNHYNQDRLDELKRRYRIHTTHDKAVILAGADLIVLTMKPYDIKSALDSIKAFLQPDQLIISVAAGVTTDYISLLIDQDNPVIRAMPNTSASIGLSASAIAKGKTATEDHLILAKQLFNTIGTTVIVDEKNMDAVTAVSGSGPAYIYYVIEAMEQAAVELGLDEVVAKSLIIQTVIGAGEMLKSTEENPATLRKNITSPAGTTEAAIKTLMTYDFQQAINAGIKSACERSKQLGEEF